MPSISFSVGGNSRNQLKNFPDQQRSSRNFIGIQSEMEGGSSFIPQPNNNASELEMLQKQHEEKTMKIQELKRQIQSVKLRLEKKRKEIPEEKMEAFKTLCEKYNSLRDEYNTLLAEKLGKK